MVAVPPAEYDRIRRRAIADLICERGERLGRGDFSGFDEVTDEEMLAGGLV